MRCAMLAFAAGILLLRFLPQLPPMSVLLVMGAFGVALLPFHWRAVGVFLLGLAWACLFAHWVLADRLPEHLDGHTFWLEGEISGLPETSASVVRFDLVDITSRHAGLPLKARLSWYGGPPVRAGERWRLAAKLKRPHGLVNPQSFDYEAWLLARRIGATGTIKAGERIRSTESANLWRDQLRQRLRAIDAHGRSGAIAALVVGDDSGLSPLDWRILQDTGTVHLMVISGQHVGLLAGLLYALVAVLARWGVWPSRLPWLPCACGLALAGALGYGWLSGFTVPVQRAVIMVVLVLLWRVRFRHLGVWLPLLVALDAVLLMDPLVSLQPGFWLSFLAVAVLLITFQGRLGAWPWWRVLGRAQWCMTVGLLPALLVLGLPISISGPVANLVAVPMVSALIVPLSLLGTALLWLPAAGEPILSLAGWLLSVLFDGLRWMASGQPAWLPPTLPLWSWLLVCAGVSLLLLPSGVPGRLLGVALLAPLLYPPAEQVESGYADVRVFDVGQGLSVLVHTANHALLYDAGPRIGDFDIGERVVYPSMRALGLARLDVMLLSHADSDHVGGALAIQRSMPVDEVISGEPRELPLVLQAEPCRTARRWEWDGVRFELWQWSGAQNGNQSSCVLLVEANGERLLLTGDIDITAEQALIQSDMPLDVRWLLVPHHGSASSSSRGLIDATTPYGALVSRSLHNAFGHPHPDVVSRLQTAGVHIFDTANSGALRVSLGRYGTALGARAERRFWREK